MSVTREDAAKTAYYKLLQSKGADQPAMQLREQVLTVLIPLIMGQPLDSASYRQAVDSCLEQTAPEQWPAFLMIIREYYPFWRDDLKAVTQYAETVGFALHPLIWQPAVIDLQAVWPALLSEPFATAERWAIHGYTKALQALQKPEMEVELRTRMAKLMVLRLREAPPEMANAYRVTADATLPLFQLKKTRHLFLSAVRQFYYFWSGHPEAATLITQEAPAEWL